jgi:hypothetical protein
MKKIMRLFAIIALILFNVVNTLMAQPLPDGPGGGPPGPGGGGPPIGAPIGDGLLILGILAALYAGKKIYELYLENKLENKEKTPEN